MSNEHLILCGGARLSSRQRAWKDAKRIDLHIRGADSNCNLRISDLTEHLTANLSPLEQDLIDIATYVYCADQAARRGGTKQIDYGETWYRDFRFEIPVARRDFWTSEPVHSDLCRCLNDLSGDNFDFAFCDLSEPRSTPEYFEYGSDSMTGVEEVVLFSGGLDSFGGAVQEILCRNRKVALVSHRANPKIDARQKRLVGEITAKMPDRKNAPVHVPVLVNKEKGLNKEYTQRTRSFLFTAIASVVARLFGLKRIRFYENGVTSLNLPISPQVVSTRATRSTHPKPLAGMCSLLNRVFPNGFGIENPFSWKTKTDVLQDVKQAGFSKLCPETVSCAHTWEMTTAQPHCGKCSQCVDRRFAALAAGYGADEDPADHYRFKLFDDNLDEPLDRALVESYIEIINRVQKCDNALQFCVEFPEVSRVLNYVTASADDTARAIYELYKRHAQQVGEALDAQGRAAIPRLRRGEISPNNILSIAFSRNQRILNETAPSQAQSGPAVTPSGGESAAQVQGDGSRRVALEQLVAALGEFLESGETSEGYDPDELDCEALEEDGEVRLAVQAVQRHYPSGKLPAPDGRNPWRSLLDACRNEQDPLKRQNEAHRSAEELREWAAGEAKKGVGAIEPATDGELQVDEAAFAISWMGLGPIHLGNRKEFHLLSLLSTARNKYLSHADLAQRLGGDELDAVTHVKSRLVKLLKEKGLDALAAKIKAQRGHYGLFFS